MATSSTITLASGAARTLPPADGIAGSNCGTPGVWRFTAAAPGPHVALTALIHGNEVCGAEALWRVVQSPPTLARGTLTIVFCNLEAYARLDDATKGDRRFVDEDMNRVWGRLGAAPASEATYEVRRARTIWPWVQDADVLLDLHSMTSPAPALGLVGLADKNVAFARVVGFPALLVRDAGHAAGLRLIDRQPFGDAAAAPAAMLVECGQHFSEEAFEAAEVAVTRTIAAVLDANALPPAQPQSVIEVTEAITIRTPAFKFEREWPNMAVVPQAGTLLAHDGDQQVRTPYDNTYLVMPASPHHIKPGLTAVRLGRRASSA